MITQLCTYRLYLKTASDSLSIDSLNIKQTLLPRSVDLRWEAVCDKNPKEIGLNYNTPSPASPHFIQ